MGQTSIRKGYVNTSAGQIHYRERPGTGTPVIFFHQTASSSAMFERMMVMWPGGHSLFALDTPGFGGSYEPSGTPTMSGYAASLFQALDGLGLQRMHLFGHHTGASVAIEIAVAHPDRVASLSMIGPITISRQDAAVFKTVYPKDFAPKSDGSHLLKIWNYVGEIGGGSSLELHHREFTDTARAWRGHVQVYNTIWDQDFTALYLRVRQPMLIMCSPRDVLWSTFGQARALRPDATVVELDGSNFQPDEIPVAVNAATIQFLSHVERSE